LKAFTAAETGLGSNQVDRPADRPLLVGEAGAAVQEKVDDLLLSVKSIETKTLSPLGVTSLTSAPAAMSKRTASRLLPIAQARKSGGRPRMSFNFNIDFYWPDSFPDPSLSCGLLSFPP